MSKLFRDFITIIIMLFLNRLAFASDTVNTSASITRPRRAPTFYTTTLAGKSFFLSKKVGPEVDKVDRKPLVLIFFTTSCIPCRVEIPIMMELSDSFPDINFYLVNMGEDAGKVKKFIKEMNYTFPVLMDPYGMVSSKRYEISSAPALVIISGDGHLLYKKTGLAKNPKNHYNSLFQNIFSSQGNSGVKHNE
ncbi:MAG: TlpA family protein disulfide reductase [Candidatus Marinimicrobia bacterium]|nr:TlpA family protein disulfide reductase [Candidatus Neomarinimicrobiota bacterium]